MNPYFIEWLARTEPLIEVAIEPSAALQYGLDTSCALDFASDFGVTSGRQLLVEAVIRRLTTARGGLIDDPDYGLALETLLNSGRTVQEFNSIADRIRSEVLKDPRFADCSVTVTGDPIATGTAHIALVLMPADESGSFELVIAYPTTEPVNSFTYRVNDAA
jgi:hypothetical protein